MTILWLLGGILVVLYLKKRGGTVLPGALPLDQVPSLTPAPVASAVLTQRTPVKGPRRVAHGGASMGWTPDRASALAAAAKILAPQGFRFVSTVPTEPGTYTVTMDGPSPSRRGYTYSVTYAIWSDQPAPSFFVPPAF